MDCDDGNYCTDDNCTEQDGCQHPYNANGCDDGNACTLDDHCSLGKCAGVVIYWRFDGDEITGEAGDIRDAVDNYPATSENDVSIVDDGKVGSAIRFEQGRGRNVGHASTGFCVDSDISTMAFWVKFDDVDAGHQTLGSFAGAGKRFYLGVDSENQIFAGYGDSFVGWAGSGASDKHDAVPSTIESGECVRMVMTYDGETVHWIFDIRAGLPAGRVDIF